MNKIRLHLLYSSQNHQNLLSESFESTQHITKGSTEKAKHTAVEELKKNKKRMNTFGKEGFLIQISKKSDSIVVGYGISEQAVSNEWCETNSNAQFTLTLTDRSETTHDKKKKVYA